jgi:hypothetical protein
MDNDPNRFRLLTGTFSLCLLILIIWVLYAANDLKVKPQPSTESTATQYSNQKPEQLLKQTNALSQQIKSEENKPSFLQPILDSYNFVEKLLGGTSTNQEKNPPPSQNKSRTTQIYQEP